jgi:hypothetical protein
VDKQQLLNGRTCQFSTECYSRSCSNFGRCMGQEESKTCSSHEDCDVGLACIPDGTFPYSTYCRKLRQAGELCYSDFECQVEQVCWPESLANLTNMVGFCREIYSLETGKVFSAAISSVDYSKNMSLINYAGQLCKSGFALPLTTSSAICMELTNITSNLDHFASGLGPNATYKTCGLSY